MKTPFYIIKRTPATKERATALWDELKENYDSFDTNASDLIDFCLYGDVGEKVYIEVGTQVRIKSTAEGALLYAAPGVGAKCRVDGVYYVQGGGANIAFNTLDDYNRLIVNSEDLSEYFELV